MEQGAIEQESRDKAKEWVGEYGADFLVELIDVYLEDTPYRLAQLRLALNGGDRETLIRQAHTLKSSSANVGAMSFSAFAKEIETAARGGKVDEVREKVRRMEEDFQLVRLSLQVVRRSAVDNSEEL